jgi:ABC-type transport system substrate-binding protein
VFHLRKGVKLHDDTDFDAEVVRWNARRIMDAEEKALEAPYYSLVDSEDASHNHHGVQPTPSSARRASMDSSG